MPSGAASADETASRLSEIIFYLICAMMVFSVVAFGAVDVWALGILSLFSGSIAMLWLANAWLKKELRLNASSLQLPLLGLIFLGLIHLLPLRSLNISTDLLSVPAAASLSLAPYSTRLAIVQLIVYSVFFAAALTFINNKNRLQKVVLLTIIFSALMAFYGILQRLASMDAIYGLRLPNQATSFSSFINAHHFAAFLEMTVGVTLALLFGKATKDNKRIFLIVAVLVMGIAILFTGSRGGLLSLLGVVGFVVTANLLKKPGVGENSSNDSGSTSFRRQFALVGGGLVLILVLFGAVLLLGGDESLLRGTGLVGFEDVSTGRTHFWQIAWRIFLDHPIIGAGLDSYATAFPQYDTWNGTFRVEQAHNDYLQILADAGIIGFAFVAAFIYLLFRKGLRVVGESKDAFRRNLAIGSLAGCAGILMHSFFDFPLRTPANALFFFILAVLAIAPISFPKPSKRYRKNKPLV